MPTTNAGATLMLQPMRGALVAAATKYLALYVGDPTSGGTEVIRVQAMHGWNVPPRKYQSPITNCQSPWANGMTAQTPVGERQTTLP